MAGLAVEHGVHNMAEIGEHEPDKRTGHSYPCAAFQFF